MNTNDNMLSGLNYIKDSQVKNKGFALIDGLFKENGWHLIKNEFEWIVYTKAGHETDLFEIRIDKNNIFLSIPIKNSSYQFRTSFNNYFQASEYLEMRFNDFCGLNN
jgi:hypothetical protein